FRRLETMAQPLSYAEMRAEIDKAGRYLEAALWTFGAIKLKPRMPGEELETAWKKVREHADKLKSAIARWAKYQIHPPADQCASTTRELISYIDDASKLSAALGGRTCISPEDLAPLLDLTNKVHEALTYLACQTERLDENFDNNVFDGFWPWLVQIRHVL